jgi:hypothetical protein
MWGYFNLCLGIALDSVAYGFVNPIFFLGGFMVLSAVPYYLSIRWIDQYGTW